MNHAEAIRLSDRLLDEGYSHAIQVGAHERLHPKVSCRVDVFPKNHFEWRFDDLVKLNQLAEEEGFTLACSSLDKKWYLA